MMRVRSFSHALIAEVKTIFFKNSRRAEKSAKPGAKIHLVAKGGSASPKRMDFANALRTTRSTNALTASATGEAQALA